jgi:TPP-dependent pyruvate/acetoin dehydrogenase alpha subunit
LNFAKVFTLPVLFVCENNQYGEYTPTTAVTPGGIVARPTALGISAETIDGQDVWEVRRASTHALAQIRAGNGPCFIEACTYRYSDHGRGDPIKYRPEGEMERWRGRDPIEIARTRLLRDYGVSPEELDVIAASALEEVQHVSSTALTAPFPDLHSTGSEFAPTP